MAKLISVDEKIFDLSSESEMIEGFAFSKNNVKAEKSSDLLPEINNQTVVDFLNCPTTKVFLLVNEEENTTKMIAHNFVANETIEIDDIGNHILAMNNVILLAMEKKKELKTNPNAEIISNDIICKINATLFKGREGEIGIGEYRDVTYTGDPCNVAICYLNEDGQKVPIEDWQPEPGGDGNIPQKMDDLVSWANSNEFKSMDPILRAAIFHAKFIKIHPFRDGNGRTGRMILNYMLAISDCKLTNIKGMEKFDYYKASAEAINNQNYEPLCQMIKSHPFSYGRQLYSTILKYSNESTNNFNHKLKTNQVSNFEK